MRVQTVNRTQHPGPRHSLRPPMFFCRALIGVLSALGLASCERAGPSAPAPAKPAAPAAPAKTYTVNGRIEQLPDPAVKGSMLTVHHEDIPGFVSREGKVVGMNSMSMPFPPAPGVSLEGLTVGDEVELTFEVRWDRIPFQQATAIRKRSQPQPQSQPQPGN